MKNALQLERTAAVRKFIDENPDITADRRRAIILLDQNPKLFRDIEDARSCVRGVVGKTGIGKLRGIKSPELTKYFYST